MDIKPELPPAAPSRMNAVAQYLMALAAVIGCYSIYLKFAVPIIEGPPNQVQRPELPAIADLLSPAVDKAELAPLLPQDAWELSNCKTLLTTSGTLLFQDFENLDDGTVQVFPFTLVSGLERDAKNSDESDSTKKNPIVLRCLEGANLKFDKHVRDMFDGDSKIRSARLTGKVDIYRPPTAADKNDALHVLTSNVRIDERRIYTLDDVLFNIGPNQGSGRNLSIDLAHDSGSDAIKDFSSISGVRKLELAFLDKLRIEPSQQSNALPIDKNDANVPSEDGIDQEKKRTLFSENNSPLEITCDGPFLFDFKTLTASFQDNVLAQQVDAFQDNIHCDQLLLTFEDTSDSGQPARPASKNENTDAMTSELQLKYFVAKGHPAIVTATSQSAKVSAAYLRFDVATSQIQAQGDPTGDQFVTLVSPEYQMVTEQLVYVIPEDGSLGLMNAQGPGRMLRLATANQDEFFATWTRSLSSRKVPGEDRQLDILVDGEAKIRIGSETRVDANQVQLITWKTPIFKQGDDGKKRRKWEYLPAKLIADGKVVMKSTGLDGTADNLTAHWPAPAKPISHAPIDRALGTQTRHVAYRGTWTRSDTFHQDDHPGKNSRTELQRISPDREVNRGAVRQVNFEQDRRPKHHIRFHGSRVEAQLMIQGKEHVLRDLTVVGDVSIIQTPIQLLPGDKPPTPMKISGEKLRIVPQGNENYRAFVSGKGNQLARLQALDLDLQGENINLDQAANKLWVEGGGAMKHRPSSPTKTAGRPTANGLAQSLKPQHLDASWDGGMIFDGSKIYFEKNVLMETQQDLKGNRRSILKSFSEGLSIELKKPVNFQKLTGDQKLDKFEVQELVLVDHVSPEKQAFQLAGHAPGKQPPASQPVILENQTFDSNGKLIEKQKIAVPQATIDADSGAMSAIGPGLLATHRPRKPNQQDGADPFSNLANSDSITGEVAFIQINFDRELNLNSQERQLLVVGNARTIYTPVQSWDQTYDPDQIDSRPHGSLHLRCERLSLAQWTPRNATKPANEMVATGNVRILNHRFDANADRVSYDQTTDLLVIEGTTRTDAELRVKQQRNAQPNYIVAEKFLYRVKDQGYEIQSFKNYKTDN